MVDRLRNLTVGRKKYGPAERAVDPQFEDSRDRFNLMVSGVGSVQSTLNKVRGDQLSALCQPVASLRNFYQDQPQTAETCSRTMRAIDDALVGYNVCFASVLFLSFILFAVFHICSFPPF